MRPLMWLIILYINCTSASKISKAENTNVTSIITDVDQRFGCFCGIFMSAQLKKGSKEQPKGRPILSQKQPISCPCNSIGNKICLNSCLTTAIKYLSFGGMILCGSLGRNCVKERAYLFIKNCKNGWTKTDFSKEYCCKDGNPYKCPVLL